MSSPIYLGYGNITRSIDDNLQAWAKFRVDENFYKADKPFYTLGWAGHGFTSGSKPNVITMLTVEWGDRMSYVGVLWGSIIKGEDIASLNPTITEDFISMFMYNWIIPCIHIYAPEENQ